jgi:hypothetical protein
VSSDEVNYCAGQGGVGGGGGEDGGELAPRLPLSSA